MIQQLFLLTEKQRYLYHGWMNTQSPEHSTYAERLAYAMKRKGMSNQSELARMIGVKPQNIQYLLASGKGSVHNAKIAEALGVNANWLAYGEGGIDVTTNNVDISSTHQADNSPSTETHVIIPRYNIQAACGNGFLNDHVEVKGGLAFRRSWLRDMGWKATDLVVVYASQESMWPTITDGAVLLVDISKLTPESGKIYLINWFGEERIKRLFRESETVFRVASDNPNKTEYPDERVDFSTQHGAHIIGRVVWQGGTL